MKKSTVIFDPSASVPGGRITQYVPPKVGMSYCLGFDTALGITGKDLDALELFDTDGQQVLEAEGTWGEHFDTIIRPIVALYGGKPRVFVCGERATLGLVLLRRLYDEGYWVYFQREEESRGRPVRDRLGHAPGKNDITVRKLQRAIAPRNDRGELLRATIRIYSAELHSQLCKFGYMPKTKTLTFDEATDADLVMGAPRGEHDDLVRAAACAVAGLDWLPAYDPPKEPFAPGTIGAMVESHSQTTKKKSSSYF